MSNKILEITLSNLSDEKIELIKRTVCKNATNDELTLFIHVCKQAGLDPFMKQIYAVKRGNTMTIQTAIDGLRLIADRTGNYAPGREPLFTYDENKNIVAATSFIKKKTSDGTWHEVSATAFYEEYKPSSPNTFWQKMPHVMLSKCAEAIVLRKAFPAEMSGLYSDEEMEQAKKEAEVVEEALQIEPKPDPLMNADQLNALEELIGDDQELLARILSGYKVDSLAKIEGRHFEPMMKNLVNRKKA